LERGELAQAEGFYHRCLAIEEKWGFPDWMDMELSNGLLSLVAELLIGARGMRRLLNI
jgi:hypothetical protein